MSDPLSARQGISANEARRDDADALELELVATRVRVTSPAPGHLDWLEEFLCPPFRSERGAGARDAVSLRHLVDAARYAALAAADWSAAPVAPAFALDAGALELPLRSEPGGTSVLRDDPFRLFYRVAPAVSRVELISREPDLRIRTPLMRVVRELVMGRAFALGWPMLHASAVERAGRVLAFTGPTSAGKTSLLVHALRIPGARFLSNDRAVVSEAADDLSIFGIPTILTLRTGALAFFPALGTALAESRFTHRLSLAEAAQPDAPAPRAGANGKFGLTPAQFCRLAGVERASAGRLTALVLPRHSGRPGGLALRRLDAETARRALHESQFGHGAWMRPTAIFKPAGADESAVFARRGEILDRVAREVPVFDGELGVDAYEDDAGLARLGALLESGG